LRGERIGVPSGSFAQNEFEWLFCGGVTLWLWRGGGRRSFIEGGKEKIAEAGVGAVREAPDVAEFLAEFAAVYVFGGGLEEGEGAGVLGDCGSVVLFELVEFAKFLGRRGIGEESVTSFGVFASGGAVVKFGFEAAADEEERRFVAFFFGGPFLGRDAWGLFAVGRGADVFDDAGGVIDGAAEGGFVAGFFEELDREEGDGHVFGSDGDEALGVGGGFGSVAKLETGFDQGAEDLRALRSLGIFQEEILKIADEGGTVIASGFDGLLEFVGGGERFGYEGFS